MSVLEQVVEGLKNLNSSELMAVRRSARDLLAPALITELNVMVNGPMVLSVEGNSEFDDEGGYFMSYTVTLIDAETEEEFDEEYLLDSAFVNGDERSNLLLRRIGFSKDTPEAEVYTKLDRIREMVVDYANVTDASDFKLEIGKL